MTCPECKRLGLTSTIKQLDSHTTLLAINRFFDDAGREHRHNQSATHKQMVCSNGHALKVTTYCVCPCIPCNWTGGTDSVEASSP